jgi:autonomous glycyl radical cofactor GrcA
VAVTAPAGAIVSLHVDLIARVDVNDIIETESGRRYRVLDVRVQQRGKHEGRQHLRVIVLGKNDEHDEHDVYTVHKIRWYKRAKRR